MSGHSKWSKVKHQKAVTDKIKSTAFTKMVKLLTIAVKEGGGITDPAKNFHIRLAIDKARSVNMPKDNIERAIQRASEKDTAALTEVTYEAYGAGNTAMIIDVASDNLNRSVSNIKNILEKSGAKMVNSGTLKNIFTKTGLIEVNNNGFTYNQIIEIALDAGADDVDLAGERYKIFTKLDNLTKVKEFFENKNTEIISVSVLNKPLITVELDNSQATEMNQLIADLEQLDDVLKVHTNIQS